MCFQNELGVVQFNFNSIFIIITFIYNIFPYQIPVTYVYYIHTKHKY